MRLVVCLYMESKKMIASKNFPENKITDVQNSIDTRSLLADYQSVNKQEVENIKKSLGIKTDNVAIYCGGIYHEKRISFLIECCDLIRNTILDFNIIFIGGGEDASEVADASLERDWMHYVGPKFGADKVVYFKLAKAFLMPGLVGLAVLDCFTTNTPMITTDYPFHSPEIDYLENGVNGIITENNQFDYVQEVIGFFQNDKKQQLLIEGCKKSHAHYTVENMAKNFADGIIKCLKA